MATVKIHDAPPPSASADLVREALKETTLTDATGRSIVVRKPGVLASYRIIEAVGAEAAANQTYMAMVAPLIYVAKIGEDPIFLPTSKDEVEALIQTLDEPGLEAVMAWYVKNVIEPVMDEAKRASEAAKLKN